MLKKNKSKKSRLLANDTTVEDGESEMNRAYATLAARCPTQHSYKTATLWRDKIFCSHNKCKMYYLSKRLQANDFRCHAIYLSELGNK